MRVCLSSTVPALASKSPFFAAEISKVTSRRLCPLDRENGQYLPGESLAAIKGMAVLFVSCLFDQAWAASHPPKFSRCIITCKLDFHVKILGGGSFEMSYCVTSPSLKFNCKARRGMAVAINLTSGGKICPLSFSGGSWTRRPGARWGLAASLAIMILTRPQQLQRRGAGSSSFARKAYKKSPRNLLSCKM